jgi:ABC-type phosphate/phosphonate transport system substrate-binding protein
MSTPFRTILFAVVFSLFFSQASAELVFSSAPRGTPQQEQARYAPFVEAMSEWLGEKVVYVYPKDFTRYSFAMRRGEYDLVLDGPHLVAWRMTRIDHEPVAKLPGKITFLVAASEADPTLNGRDSLIARRVCGLASPHLGTLQYLAQYRNPVQQPTVFALRGGFKNVFKQFKAGKCDAVLLRDLYYDRKLNDVDKLGLHVVYDVPALPDQALTAGPRLNDEQKRILRERLTNPVTAAGPAKGILKPWTRGADAFVSARPEEYRGLEVLLTDSTWGWK